MRIVVMSDSHGYNSAIYDVLELEEKADMFIHCGDICEDDYMFPQLKIVSGNNDYYGYPMERMIDIENHRILVVHSHQFPFMKREEKMVRYAKEHGCDIVCFGHTHVTCDKVIEGVHLLNPGSLYMSRDGKPASYAILELDKDEIKTNVIYFDRKKG